MFDTVHRDLNPFEGSNLAISSRPSSAIDRMASWREKFHTLEEESSSIGAHARR